MKLIWTYNSDVVFGNQFGVNTPEMKVILLNYYIHSIQTAIKLNYHTIIYCDSKSYTHFKNVADEVIIVDNYENSPLWDSFKIKVLEDRDDDFCLIDGDVILHNKLPQFTTDVVFDSYELNNFKNNYKDILNYLSSVGIENELEFWENKQLPIISCGILSIRNKELKDLYVSNWKLYNQFISKYINDVDIDLATMVGAQYLLSLLSQKVSHTKLSNLVGYDNPYYKHHCGPGKYNTPLVPTDNLIYKIKKELI
jgi:hypothetical protein